MAISVQFGTCSCENHVVDKSGSVQFGTAVACEMVNTDILNPVFKVNTVVTDNYCYCSDFGRYYFIESIEGCRGGHSLVSCHVDVLYTYASEILGLECYVGRNEYDRDPDIMDPMVPIKVTSDVYDKIQYSSALFTTSDIFAYYLVKIAN